MLGLSTGISKAAASLKSYVKDNLKLYLDFKSKNSDTLKFPCEGSTSFDGTNDVISLGEGIISATLNGASQATMAFWFKADTIAADEKMVNILIKTTASGMQMKWQDTSKIQMGGRSHEDDGFIYDISATAFSVGTWYHVAGIWDFANSKLYLYVDGVLDGDIAGTSVTFSAGIGTYHDGNDQSNNDTIGSSHDGTTNPFDGKIANVGIWSRALSLEEIQSIMRKKYSQLKGTETTSLVSWWALDSGGTSLVTTGGVYGLADSKEVLGSEVNTTAQATSPTNETDATTGWTAVSGLEDNSTFTSDSTVYSTGSYSLKVVTNSGGGAVNYPAFFYDWSVATSTKYKVSITWKSNGTGASDFRMFFGATSGGSTDYFNTGDHTGSTDWVTETMYFTTSSTTLSFKVSERAMSEGALIMWIDNISIKPVTSGNEGLATNNPITTTSVYGGNAPVLDRAVDVAKEGQADAIGGGSASFDGVDDYINIGDVELITTAGTISAWVKNDVLGGGRTHTIVGKYNTSSQRAYFIQITSSLTVQFAPQSNSASYTSGEVVTGATSLAAGTWYHIAGTFSTSEPAKVYLNGVLDGTASSAIANAIDNVAEPLKIGSDASNYTDGNICQVGIWSSVLTQAQIQSVMESTFDTMTPSIKTNLVGYWALDADASDSTDNNNDGTLV